MIVVELELDSPILRSTCRSVPEMAITLEAEQAPGGRPGAEDGPIRLHFWATGGDFEAFDAALAEDPSVTSPAVLLDTGERRLYSVRYTTAGMAGTSHRLWVEVDGQLLEGWTNGVGWLLRMRFPDHAAARQFIAGLDDLELTYRVTNLLTEDATRGGDRGPRLTGKQLEALETAWEEGYFEVPRGMDLEALSERLGVSAPAVSARLRRALSAVLREELGPRGDDA